MTGNGQNIFLIGMMGAGKSTIGRMLATRLERRFFDSDHEIEARTGVRVPMIFEMEGEAGFRRREVAMIDELTQMQGIVLATGGGAIMNAQTRQHLRERGLTIYLSANIQELWQRVRRDRSRPLLQTANPLARIETLMLERDPYYRETADLIVDSTRGGSARALETIIEHLRNNQDVFARQESSQ